MNEISPIVTIVSAVLIVVVLIIALNLREKIKKTESGNEFLPWERHGKMNLPEEIEADLARGDDEEYEEYDEDEYDEEGYDEEGYDEDEDGIDNSCSDNKKN